MAKLLVCVVLLSISISGIAQSRMTPSAEDIRVAKKLKTTYNDSDKDILILSKNVDVTFSLNKSDGLVRANLEEEISMLNMVNSSQLRYPIFYDSESEVKKFAVKDRKGRTLNGLSFTPKDEYMKSEDLFHTDYRVKYIDLVFPLKGSRFSVSTGKQFRDAKYFTSFYFSDDFRVHKGTLTVTIPDWLELEMKEFNFDNHKISKKKEKVKNGEKITYTFHEIAPQYSESNSVGPSFLYPHLLFITKSYTSNGEKNNLFNSIDDLYGWYSSLVEQVEVESSSYREKVAELTSNTSGAEEKIKNIYYWVQDNIRYVAFEDGIAGFKPDSPQNVFNKRYGDCKGMAILTKAMLVEAGFDARLVWLGTDRLAYDYSTPSLAVDNHMICSVMQDGEAIFLDGTEKYNRFGEYATRIQNKQALIEDQEGYKILKVPVTSSTNEMEVNYSLSIEDEMLKGTVKRVLDGECRVDFQNVFNTLGKRDKLKFLSRYLADGNSSIEVNEIYPMNWENRENALEIIYDLNIENAISEFDGEIYLDIDPDKSFSDLIIDEDRMTDFNFHIKQRKSTKISLDIPVGYGVNTMPEGIQISNDYLDISVTYEEMDNVIVYTKSYDLKKRIIPKSEFDLWNKSFEKLKENSNQQITLSKI